MRSVLLIAALAPLAACAPASDYRPAVDLTDVDPQRYETDLRDCKAVAERDRYAPLFVAVVTGAAVGTSLGAAGGAFAAANAGLGESYGAIIGAVGGAVGGASEVHEPQDEPRFVEECLRNNGYVVQAPKTP